MGGGQGGSEPRIEVIVKIQNNNKKVVGVGGGGAVRTDVNQELNLLCKCKK